MNPMIPFKCPRRVGFLFPHSCERLTPIGCPDCNNGSVNDPYSERDRHGYNRNGYDTYDSSETSNWSPADSAAMPVFGGGDSGGAGASMDFTEADGDSLASEDSDFESDPSAS